MKKDKNYNNGMEVVHSSRKSRVKTSKTPSKKKQYDSVESIWKGIQNNEIDITLAIIGYTYSNGLPIFNSDDMFNLLLQYGCNISTIYDFMEDFAKVHEKNPQTPILMMSMNKFKICQAFS